MKVKTIFFFLFFLKHKLRPSPKTILMKDCHIKNKKINLLCKVFSFILYQTKPFIKVHPHENTPLFCSHHSVNFPSPVRPHSFLNCNLVNLYYVFCLLLFFEVGVHFSLYPLWGHLF